jgi:hypothetical protein
MSRGVIVGCVLAALGCGPSSAEVRRASATKYRAPAGEILALAESAAEESYKIGEIDREHTSFVTQPRFYSSTGDLESPGAEGVTMIRPGSVRVAFVVEVVPVDDQHVAVTVTPHTLQALAGSPQPRELKPDDPYLPGFVLGRTDALAYAIYEHAKKYAER